ncbi:rho guanine nucleotide exchange factor 16-like [Branchiostoma floridae]|uniref:Rho guanine nucleotide exchange factor 16-like n=1 Tax=Branchiostoma floridae TaxID=7739 RepID=A0A9J7KHC9_BRAFL|nr:rho guanine nucleotide exchange factor 16-like [Branchiostoma floridae]
MTPSDVQELFESDPEVEVYAELFKENEIDGTTLLELDEKMLKEELGIQALGARMKIKRKISSLINLDGVQARPTVPMSSKLAPIRNFRVEYYDDTSVTVSWGPSRDDLDGYKLEIAKTEEPALVVHRQTLPPEDTSVTCSSLQNSTSYTIKLTALAGILESDAAVLTIFTSEEYTDTIVREEYTDTIVREEYTDTIPNPRARFRSSRAESTSSLDFLTAGPLYQELRSERTPSIHKGARYETPIVVWNSNLGQNWSTLPEVVKSNVRYEMSTQQRQLQEAIFEVLKTEGSYLHSMTIFVQHFMSDEELRRSIKSSEYKALMSNSGEVLKASQLFFNDLKARQEKNVVVNDICDIIVKHAKKGFLVPYKNYCKNLPLQESTLKSLTEGTQSQELNQNFCDALKKLEMDERCGKLPFSSFLLLPMQRITRFPLMVERIMNMREADTKLFNTALDALTAVRNVSKQCNQATRKEQQMIELEDLVKKLAFDKVNPNFSLLNKERSIIKQGELTWIPERGKKTKTYIVLLTDYLLVTKKKEDKKEGGRLSLRNFCKRDRVAVREIDSIYDSCEDLSVAKKEQRGFMSWFWSKPVEENFKFSVTLLEDCKGKQEEMVFAAKTPSELTRWVEAFQQLGTDEEEGRIYPKENCPIVRVILRRDPEEPDELALEEGDALFVLRKKPDGWWFGETMHDERRGWFPATVVEEVRESDHFRGKELRREFTLSQLKEGQDQEIDKHTYTVLYDYESDVPEDLKIKKDQRLKIIDYRDGKWYKAQSLDTLEVGLVPFNYVTPLNELQGLE